VPDLILRISTSMTTRRVLRNFSSENVKCIVIFSAKLSSELTFRYFFLIEPCVVELMNFFTVIYIYVYVRIYIYQYTYVRIYICVYICKYINIYVCI